MNVYDLLIDTGGDLQMSGGDFVIGESTQQHQRALVVDNKGDYKDNPNACVGVFNYIDDEGLGNLAQAISEEFVRDGMIVTNVSVGSGGKISAVSNY